ncbi:30S ribosomal protein S18 [Candidatus Uhrbacteria bacterium]|nr:30S ribosomal protein S18 [Candidatus Uhrbacteria bacterium]
MEIKKERQCYFCRINTSSIDYKDTALLRRYLSSYGKIVPRRRSGVCAWHQRKLAKAIKRARIMVLLPFVVR